MENQVSSQTLAASLADLMKNGDLTIYEAFKKALKEVPREILSDGIKSIHKEKKIKKELHEAYRSGKLVLVLGAGVSIDYGLPTWDTLLQALLARIYPKTDEVDDLTGRYFLFAEVFNGIFEPNPLIAGRYLSDQFKKRNDHFEEAVRELLYQHFSEDFTSDLMEEIVQTGDSTLWVSMP